MDFDLTKFTLSPTLKEFERCRKRDLIQIAEFYKVTVLKDAKKQVIKDELYGRLVENGILPGLAPELEIEEELTFDKADSVSGKKVAGLDPMLTVRLRELDLELKKQEHETQLL